MEKEAVLDDIGRVLFVKRAGRGSLVISIKPSTGIRVLVPAHISLTEAGKLVTKKKAWIKKQQARIAAFEAGITKFTEDTDFKTCERSVRLHTHDKNTIKTVIARDWIYVYYPDHAEIGDARIQQAIRKAVVEAWRLEARKILPPMVEKLAREHGFSYGRITVRNNRTRWGSCSRNNNISLNLHLIRLPLHLCKYVILHELTHTIHKNHGKPFWGLLQEITGKARALDKDLSAYRIDVW